MKNKFDSAASQMVYLYYSAQAADRMNKTSTSDAPPELSAYVREEDGSFKTIWFTAQCSSEESAKNYRWPDKTLQWKGLAHDMVLIEGSIKGLPAEEAFKQRDEAKARELSARTRKATTVQWKTTIAAPRLVIPRTKACAAASTALTPR